MTVSEVFILPNGQKLFGVHDGDTCTGPCVIHNPMVPYTERNLIWRDDRGIFEDICKHGVGHPSPEQYDYWYRTGQSWQAVHACDGCWY